MLEGQRERTTGFSNVFERGSKRVMLTGAALYLLESHSYLDRAVLHERRTSSCLYFDHRRGADLF
jgi:hypothetical protein